MEKSKLYIFGGVVVAFAVAVWFGFFKKDPVSDSLAKARAAKAAKAKARKEPEPSEYEKHIQELDEDEPGEDLSYKGITANESE